MALGAVERPEPSIGTARARSEEAATLDLSHRTDYEERGLSPEGIGRLSVFGDMLLASQSNVTAVRDSEAMEEVHFLDSLSFLDIPEVLTARSLLDVGAGGGLPAVVLAIALPDVRIVALDSVGKKCAFIESVRARLSLQNLEVVCARSEDYGRTAARESFEVVVARAVAPLPILAELCVPLVRVGGVFVAAKGALSDQERIEGAAALAILGCDPYRSVRARSFERAENRWLLVAKKERDTPAEYPRRAGMPAKRPLGAS